jgi:type I restriction enzyme S subunit
LNRELILNFFIPIPPVDEQKKINQNIISSFELINSINRNKLDLSKIINQAKSKILDLAIRGKLVPQDPNDEPASVLLERIKSEHPESKKKAKNTGDNSHYPFEIPAGWEWSKLGCIASYKKGPFGSNITKSMFIPDSINAIKVYEQKNAIYKDFNLGNYYISEAKFEELKGFEVHPNDILVSCAGTIGETYVMPQDIRKGIINQALMRIKLYNYEMLDFYLMYFDFVLKNLANEEGKGTAIKNIPPFDILKNFLIPLPPLSEQKKIIKKIKEIFNSLDRIANSIKA